MNYCMLIIQQLCSLTCRFIYIKIEARETEELKGQRTHYIAEWSNWKDRALDCLSFFLGGEWANPVLFIPLPCPRGLWVVLLMWLSETDASLWALSSSRGLTDDTHCNILIRAGALLVKGNWEGEEGI